MMFRTAIMSLLTICCMCACSNRVYYVDDSNYNETGDFAIHSRSVDPDATDTQRRAAQHRLRRERERDAFREDIYRRNGIEW